MSFSFSIRELIGWYGAFAILLAYALVSFNFLPPTHLAYHLLNGSGALGLISIALRKRDYPSAGLNIAWTLIAAIALIRIFFT